MTPIAFAIAVPAAFAAGVVFAKYVISEATAIKQHVTAAEKRISDEISSALERAASKV